MQQKIVLKLLFVAALLALVGWALASKGIRLGKDLRGGTSLIYQVAMEDVPAGQREETLQQVIRVLQDRVNPQGVLDISMQSLGDDRIEVVMPLPSPEVQALRREYEQVLHSLVAEAQIPAPQLDAALRENRAVEQFGGQAESERATLVQNLQDAYNDMLSTRGRLRELRESGAEAQEITRAEAAVAEAMIRHDDLRAGVLRLSLDRSRIERVLALPSGRETEGNDAEAPARLSPRDVELSNIKTDFPHLSDAIDQAVGAYDAYQAKRTGLDDPEDLKRLLRGAGVLDFRIAVRTNSQDVNIDDLRRQLRERGPENTDSPVARWYEINDLRQWYEDEAQLIALQADPESFFAGRGFVAAQRDGRYYLLLYTTRAKSITHGQHGEDRWSITQARRDIDQQGRPAVGFRLDATGGRYMSRLTGSHLGEPMAIVLDNQVYSAPFLQGNISTQGIITGRFTSSDINYLTRVLAAGSLEARLNEHPIAQNNLGPSIGTDNLRAGLSAFVIAIVAVAVFMVLYYFVAGIVAVIALAANGLLIFGVMSALDGTFTLPGLAGIVLTIGMAVDANVLIYERIREEMFSGEWDLRGAIRQGYAKALSTILDANITNLIVCVVLFNYATTEVRGFALTLTIGIAATLFTALFVTRQIYLLYTDVFKARHLPMLPTVVPAIHHFLEPNINWVGMRKAFWAVSAVAVLASAGLVATRGIDLIDTELRGGVAVTMRTALVDPSDAETDGERYWLPHVVGDDSVESRVRQIAQRANPEAAQTADERQRQLVLAEFARASVLTVGETEIQDGRVVGQSFQIKLPNPKDIADEATTTDVVIEAIVDEFDDLLDVAPPIRFTGVDSDDHSSYTYPIEHEELGENIERPRFTERVTEFLGGVAIVLDDIQPPVTLDEVRARIERMRGQPDFADARGRTADIIGLDESDQSGEFQSVVVLVADPAVSYLRDDPLLWDRQVGQMEWRLVTEAMAQPPSLEQVSSFSAAVARTLAASAVVAVLLSLGGILVYIWIRFGSLRYSAAAVVALVHDVTIALGLIALSAWVARTWLGDLLLVDEFRIDLAVVAALLTIIGYSLNDTIVILDRIRENRGKLPLPTAATVNRSINQTLSRTVLTSLTTLLAVAIMYVAGGTGIRPFAFCLLIGLLVGTYSSVAVAAPLVFQRGRGNDGAEDAEREQEQRFGAEPEPA